MNQTKRNTQIINKRKDEIGKKYIKKKNNDILYTDIEPIKIKIDDSNKNNNCILVEKNQIKSPYTQDDVINNTYSILEKMNRMSNILLNYQRKKEMKKGGVVKLFHKDLQKTKFNIRKPETKIADYFSNWKYRDKAAKMIQAWWRKRKNDQNKLLNYKVFSEEDI